jgi:amidophosphoribosyltransferase
LKPVREACGVFGVYNPGNLAFELIFYGLTALQHRGQESAGIAAVEDGKLKVEKAMGLVGEIFSPEQTSRFKGEIGIGHVRYSTVGTSSIVDAQPFQLNGIAVCHNGNIVNYLELRKLLTSKGIKPVSSCDAEILGHLINSKKSCTDANAVVEALGLISELAEGSYSALCLTGKGEIVAFRDPYGFRPLCYGMADEAHLCASESVAIDICGGNILSNVEPGEALIISRKTVERVRFAACPRRAHCMFEYVYFSRPDTMIEGKSVYEARLRLGENLGKTYGCDADIVVPVPDTARPAAEGIARVTGTPVAEGLIKNRYIHRTFIMPGQQKRENAVKMKLNPLKAVLKGKSVCLVDDSIVRGTTIRKIIGIVREAGAREVHVKITCPPIISPCFYGIDIATHQELIAARRSIDEVRHLIGADSLNYQTLKGLIEAIGLGKENLCLACLTGNYPTPKAQRLADKMKGKPPPKAGFRYIELEEAA